MCRYVPSTGGCLETILILFLFYCYLDQYYCWCPYNFTNTISYITTKTVIKKCDESGIRKNWKPFWVESAKSFVIFVPVSNTFVSFRILLFLIVCLFINVIKFIVYEMFHSLKLFKGKIGMLDVLYSHLCCWRVMIYYVQ